MNCITVPICTGGGELWGTKKKLDPSFKKVWTLFEAGVAKRFQCLLAKKPAYYYSSKKLATINLTLSRGGSKKIGA